MTSYLIATSFGFLGSKLAAYLGLYGYASRPRERDEKRESVLALAASVSSGLVYGSVGFALGSNPILWSTAILVGRVLSHCLTRRQQQQQSDSRDRGQSVYLLQVVLVFCLMQGLQYTSAGAYLKFINNPVLCFLVLPLGGAAISFATSMGVSWCTHDHRNGSLDVLFGLLSLGMASAGAMIGGLTGLAAGSALYLVTSDTMSDAIREVASWFRV